MDRRLLTPGMIAMHLVVVLAAVVFVRLGLWQLDRLEERRAENAVGEMRLQAEPKAVADLLQDELDPESLVYQRVTATGVFDAGNEVLIRSQTHLGAAGFHVISPMVMDDGQAIMVNRGWVPLELDQAPVTGGAPPQGVVTVEGWLRPSQTRPPLGREEPAGDLEILNRVDLARIEDQVPYPLFGMYLVEIGERAEPPIPVEAPDFSDEGPHLAYAIQWFAFAVIAVIGYLALLRRRSSRPQEGMLDMARPGTTS